MDSAAGAIQVNTVPATKRKRGIGRSIALDKRIDIARQINEEKKSANEVARMSGLPLPSVWRIAGLAKGDAKFAGKTGRRQIEAEADVTMPACPFPADELPNLRGKRLSVDEKYYLSCLINIQGVPCVRVAEQFGLNDSTLRKMANKALVGKSLEGLRGKQTTLDSESDKALRAVAVTEGVERPSRDEMKALILAEAAKTKERRHNSRHARANIVADDETGRDVSPRLVQGSDVALSGPKIMALSKTTYAKYLAVYGY